ncbi:probable serine/threonine-protein kinase WNK7 isoform X4 [Chenopodium quinoa]|uniref:probable serine/threonine-protein kinase WNK7 isoform X4 n=1 Tax=Chenopodium quinoa TaxID=63459 RepID=UPI000B76DDFE|nr:probable serine/threonine-protein kinase WNK7 isoform X4 [Chenopodium quinoa]
MAAMSHPNIVRYYSAWVEREIAGKFFEAGEEKGSYEELKCIAGPILYIQQELCSRDGKAKIGDFGLASLAESGIFGEYSPRAIGAYCAPEVSEGNYSLSSDIYSLGIILLEMLRDFKTDMEKAQELQHFKDHSELLSPWHVDKKEEKMGFICLLTNSDPSLRPSQEL